MSFKITHTSTNARVGILDSGSRSVETPFFMPVATKAVAKFITIKDFLEIGTDAIISNSFVLYLKPGLKVVGDIHDYMNFQKFIFTDCGAFQMLREAFFRGFSKNGIKMQDPFIGKKFTLKPTDAMDIQLSLKCDVAMALDNLPHSEVSKEVSERSVELTTKWHKICLDYHKKKKKELNQNQLLFGICQGAIYPELREKHALELSKMDFDGLAIGGLCIGESKELMYKCVEACMNNFRKDLPIYHMGVGSPEDIIKNVDMGVDMFDSAYPTRVARHGWLFTKNGLVKITNSEHKHSDDPIDKTCNCYVCKTHSKKYIYNLLKMKEPTAYILTSYHNLFFIQNLMKNIKNAIKSDNWNDFKKDFLDNYKVS